MIGANLTIFVLSVISLGCIVIGGAILFRRKWNASNFFFSLFAIFAGLWGAFSIIRFYAFDTFAYMPSNFIFTKLGAFAVATAFYALLLFAFSFPSGVFAIRKRCIFICGSIYALLSAFILGTSAVVVSNEFVVRDGVVPFQPNTEWGMLYSWFFIPFIIMCFVVGIGRLLLFYRKTTRKQEKAQLLYILLGLGIGTGISLASWFLAPFFPNAENLFWLSRFSVFIFVAITAYALLRDRFMNFKAITAEFFTFIILIFLLAQTISSIGDWQEFAINAGLFVFVVFFGSLLIGSVRKEIKHTNELKHIAKRLTDTNARLAELDTIKSQFLSFASHQVKTPMTVIRGYVSLLEDDVETLTNEQIKDMAGHIRISTDKTIRLVNNLLALRRIEEGRMEYHMDALNIVSVAEDAVEELSVMAQSKQLPFTYTLPKEDIIVRIDSLKMRQVFQNLIENAIKHTKEGNVTVDMYKEEEELVFRVTDTGEGISPEHLEGIFHEFHDGVAKETFQGKGLGLYIARRIVDGHQGSISASSEGKGKGSEFVVRLPLHTDL
jgi:signal transduction histidine kinase